MEKVHTLQGNSVEEITADATSKGLYVVNQDDHGALFAEYAAVIEKAEKLCNANDPVKEPYKSKYEARALIDQVVNKLEATRTIASLEKNRAVMDAMNWRLASLRVRLGLISWDVEEPHNAQTELEQALEWYIPGLPAVVNETLVEADDAPRPVVEAVLEGEAAEDAEVGKGKVDYRSFDMLRLLGVVDRAMARAKATENAAASGASGAASPSSASKVRTNITYAHNGGADAVKCFNLLGILWAGRVQLKRAFYYMHSAVVWFRRMKAEGVATARKLKAAAASFGPLPPPPKGMPAAPVETVESNAAVLEELESIHTHTLFYLAQAYGHVGNSTQSSVHCYHTLRRQLKGVLEPQKDEGDSSTSSSNNSSVLEWCNNCQGLCDFFLATEQFHHAAYVLSVAEKVLKERYRFVASAAPTATGSASGAAAASAPVQQHGVDDEPYYENLAKLHRRWAKLDHIVLRQGIENSGSWSGVPSAFKPAAAAIGLSSSDTASDLPPPPAAAGGAAVTADALVQSVQQAMDAAKIKAGGSDESEEEVDAAVFAPFNGINVEETPFITSDINKYGPGAPTPSASTNTNINCYDDARRVFVRAQARLESAKKFFLMDGFVSDHIQLLQDHSKLFSLLCTVENDVKRRLAMALRRADMLFPLLDSVSRNAFEDFHKQLSYEVGEIYQSCVEWKLEKLLAKQAARGGAGGTSVDTKAGNLEGGDVADLNNLKLSEAMQVNEYALRSLCCFAYFTKFYGRRSGKDAQGAGDASDSDVTDKEENAAATISALAGVNINTAKPISAQDAVAFDDLLRIAVKGSNAGGTVVGSDCGSSVIKTVLKAFCTEPDMKLLSAEETRPFLNSHFISARLVTKMLPVPAGTAAGTVGCVGSLVTPAAALGFQMEVQVESLRKYEWLHKTIIPRVLKSLNAKLQADLAKQKEQTGEDLSGSVISAFTVRDIPFEAEADIIKDMVALLPAKLDTLARNRARFM